jgi:hypothetical protein
VWQESPPVEITTRTATTLEAVVDVNVPEPDLAAQYERLSQKFERLARRVIGTRRTAALRQLLSGLDDRASVRELMSLTRPG